MTKKDWDELARLSVLGKMKTVQACHLMSLTEQEEEHPEDYDGPCWCALCRSYVN
jgi:hypothetical protein